MKIVLAPDNSTSPNEGNSVMTLLEARPMPFPTHRLSKLCNGHDLWCRHPRQERLCFSVVFALREKQDRGACLICISVKYQCPRLWSALTMALLALRGPSMMAFEYSSAHRDEIQSRKHPHLRLSSIIPFLVSLKDANGSIPPFGADYCGQKSRQLTPAHTSLNHVASPYIPYGSQILKHLMCLFKVIVWQLPWSSIWYWENSESMPVRGLLLRQPPWRKEIGGLPIYIVTVEPTS